MATADTFLDSVDSVKAKLLEGHQLVCKKSDVHKIMRTNLGMKFRKIKSISLTANSVKNLILRQQFALEFLKIDLNKKVIINVDESWIGMADFRRRKWCLPRSTNSVPQLQINPRISMIVALDSTGAVYFSLL